MSLKLLFKKQNSLERENRQFEKQFSNKFLLKKIKNKSIKEQRIFVLDCFENCLKSTHLNGEISERLIELYRQINDNKELNIKKNYKFISPKLIEEEETAIYDEKNPFLLSKEDLRIFSRFFYMIPVDLISLFDNVEKAMLRDDKELILNNIYDILTYMNLECIAYPKIL